MIFADNYQLLELLIVVICKICYFFHLKKSSICKIRQIIMLLSIDIFISNKVLIHSNAAFIFILSKKQVIYDCFLAVVSFA